MQTRPPKIVFACGLVVCLLLLAFECHAADGPDGAAISVAIGQPVSSSATLVGPALAIEATVVSTYDVKRVHAEVEAVGVDLSPPASAGGPWTGTMDIDSLPRGLKTLVVRAADSFDATASASATFFHDDPPVITVASPLDPSVARPDVHVVAQCTDDDTGIGCVTLTATLRSSLCLADAGADSGACGSSISGASNLDATFTIGPGDEGDELVLILSASDSKGQSSSRTLSVFVDRSSALVPVVSVGGAVLDFDGTRTLYRRLASEEIVLHSSPSSTETRLGPAQARSPKLEPRGWLTSRGAVWRSVVETDGYHMQFWEWRGEQASMLHERYSAGLELQVNGDYAAWLTRTPPGAVAKLRNLTTGTETDLLGWSPEGFPNGYVALALGPAGSVVGVSLEGCSVYRLGTARAVKIGSLSPRCFSTSSIPYPLFDGNNIAYNEVISAFPRTLQISIMDLGGTAAPLSDTRPIFVDPAAGYYALAGGWAAYLKKSFAGVEQVWLRSPTAALTQLSAFSTDNAVEAISASGEVMFMNGHRRYFASTTSPVIEVSSSLGHAVTRCGAWYVLLGNTVFRVAGVGNGGDPDCEPVDGGSSDGSSFDANARTDADPAVDDASPRDAGGAGSADASTTSDADALDVAGGLQLEGRSGAGCGCMLVGARRPATPEWLLSLLVPALALRRRRVARA